MVDFNVAISTIKDNNGFVSNDKDDSFYRTYLTKGTKPIQVRISNHGTHLWTWDKNGEYIPSYAINICVVLSPNGEVDSNTVVDMNVYDNARNIVGQKKDYEVIQYVYNCTNLNAEEVHKINETIINIPTTRNFIDPFRMDVVKHANVYRLKPNQKPQLLTQPIQENNNKQINTNKNMKINESQLRKIIKESIKSVLNEGYYGDIDGEGRYGDYGDRDIPLTASDREEDERYTNNFNTLYAKELATLRKEAETMKRGRVSFRKEGITNHYEVSFEWLDFNEVFRIDMYYYEYGKMGSDKEIKYAGTANALINVVTEVLKWWDEE